MNLIRQETDPRYVLIEGIQLTEHLKMLVSLGNNLLNGKFRESNIEEWSKSVLGIRRK